MTKNSRRLPVSTTPMTLRPSKILILSGNDPSGAAGFIADLRTATKLNCYAAGTPTALTVQSFTKSYDFLTTPTSLLEKQLQILLEDFSPDVVKIGMLTSPKQAEILAENLPQIPVIYDPVFQTSAGTRFFASEKKFRETIQILAPKLFLLTPNLPELEILAETKIHTLENLKSVAPKIQAQYNLKNLLVKGGHLNTKDYVFDFLFSGKKTRIFKHLRSSNKDFRGTGCVLSTATACFLTTEKTLEKAYLQARNFLALQMENAEFIAGKYIL